MIGQENTLKTLRPVAVSVISSMTSAQFGSLCHAIGISLPSDQVLGEDLVGIDAAIWLIEEAERQKRLASLYNYAGVAEAWVTGTEMEFIHRAAKYGIAVKADSLGTELTDLRRQVLELQQQLITDEHMEQRVKDILETADRAVGQSEELKARLILPPTELTDVRLVPSHSLERIEEYHSDENLAFLLIGAFLGALLGIPVNWVTNEQITFNGASILLAILFLCLTLVCVYWLLNLKKRTAKVREQMFRTGEDSRQKYQSSEAKDS